MSTILDELPQLTGRVYQAPSGQWSYELTENGAPWGGGAGYGDEYDASEAMFDHAGSHPVHCLPVSHAKQDEVPPHDLDRWADDGGMVPNSDSARAHCAHSALFQMGRDAMQYDYATWANTWLPAQMHCALEREGEDVLLTVLQPSPSATVRLTPVVANALQRYLGADGSDDLDYGSRAPLTLALPQEMHNRGRSFPVTDGAVSDDDIALAGAAVDHGRSHVRHLHSEPPARSPGAILQAQGNAADEADSKPSLWFSLTLRGSTAPEALARLRDSLAEIAAERARQIDQEGFDAAHDDTHFRGELARAASCYVTRAADTLASRRHSPITPPMRWPWHSRSWKPRTPRQDLICAAALIVAELDRMTRADLRRIRDAEHTADSEGGEL